MVGKASEESDNLANVSNVSLNDIKKFIVKYRTLPINNKAQSEAEKSTYLVNNNNKQSNRVDKTNENNTYADNKENDNRYTYNSKSNNRNAYLRRDADDDEVMNIYNDNEYYTNVMTDKHRDALEKILISMRVLEKKTDVYTQLNDMKLVLVDTIKQNLQRSNNVINSGYQQNTQDVYQSINEKLNQLTNQNYPPVDSLGTIQNIDTSIRSIHAEILDLKKIVDQTRVNYDSLNKSLVDTSVGVVTHLNALVNRDSNAAQLMLINSNEYLANQTSIANSQKTQAEMFSEMSAFIADLKNFKNDIQSTNMSKDTKNKVQDQNPTSIDLGDVTKKVEQVIRDMFTKQNADSPVIGLMELNRKYEQALQLVTHNQTLALTHTDNKAIVDSVTNNNKNILGMAQVIGDYLKNYEEMMTNFKTSITESNKQNNLLTIDFGDQMKENMSSLNEQLLSNDKRNEERAIALNNQMLLNNKSNEDRTVALRNQMTALATINENLAMDVSEFNQSMNVNDVSMTDAVDIKQNIPKAIGLVTRQLNVLTERGQELNGQLIGIEANFDLTRKQQNELNKLIANVQSVIATHAEQLGRIITLDDSRQGELMESSREIGSLMGGLSQQLPAIMNTAELAPKLLAITDRIEGFNKTITDIETMSNSRFSDINDTLNQTIQNINNQYELSTRNLKESYSKALTLYNEENQTKDVNVNEVLRNINDMVSSKVEQALKAIMDTKQENIPTPASSNTLTSLEKGDSIENTIYDFEFLESLKNTTNSKRSMPSNRLQSIIRERFFNDEAIAHNSDTSSLPPNEDEVYSFKAIRDSIVKEAEKMTIAKVQKQTIINEITNSVKSGRLIDDGIFENISNRKDILKEVARYNVELIMSINDKRNFMIRDILNVNKFRTSTPIIGASNLNDISLDVSTIHSHDEQALLSMSDFTYDFLKVVNSVRNKKQLNILKSSIKPLDINRMGPLDSIREGELIFQTSLINTLYVKAEQQIWYGNGVITNNSLPVATTSSQSIGTNGDLPATFVTNNFNHNLVTLIDPSTQQTSVIKSARLAIQPVPQQEGGTSGAPLVMNNEVKTDIIDQTKDFIKQVQLTSIDNMNMEELTDLSYKYTKLFSEIQGTNNKFPSGMGEIAKGINKRFDVLNNSESQYLSEAAYENLPGGNNSSLVVEPPSSDNEDSWTEDNTMETEDPNKTDPNKTLTEDNNTSIVKRPDWKLESKKKQLDKLKAARQKKLLEDNKDKNKTKETQSLKVNANRRILLDKKRNAGEGVSRRNMHSEIESSKEEINSNKDYVKKSREFLNNESIKRKHKHFKGYGVHKSLEFRKKLINLIKSGRVTSKKGNGVSKKLVCSLCNNEKKDNDYHMTKSKEVLHKKCFEGKGMTKKRKLYDEDYGEDITADSKNKKLREMHEGDFNAKQNEIMDMVKLNNVHNDHIQSITSKPLLNLIKRSKHGYVAWGTIDSKLFSLLCHLLSVFNNNKDNASGWDYINYQVLRSKYLLSVKANPKKIKYIDIDTSNLQSVEKTVKANPEILFDFDFNE